MCQTNILGFKKKMESSDTNLIAYLIYLGFDIKNWWEK